MAAKPKTNKTISGHSADIRSSVWLGSASELQAWTATLDKMNPKQLSHVMAFIIQKLCTGKNTL